MVAAPVTSKNAAIKGIEIGHLTEEHAALFEEFHCLIQLLVWVKDVLDVVVHEDRIVASFICRKVQEQPVKNSDTFAFCKLCRLIAEIDAFQSCGAH